MRCQNAWWPALLVILILNRGLAGAGETPGPKAESAGLAPSPALTLPAAVALTEPENAADDDAPWSDFAGWKSEREGERLELRDELISSHLAFLNALELAIAEAGQLPPEKETTRLAWARVEYLLETAYRLLAASGEFDAFLKVTAPLRPAAAANLEAISLAAEDPPGGKPDGGLIFTDPEGKVYILDPGEKGDGLVDVETGQKPAKPEGIFALPAKPAVVPFEAQISQLRSRAAWLRALALERLGKTAEAGQETAHLGLIRDWLFWGPLDGAAEYQSQIVENPSELYDSLGAALSSPNRRLRAVATTDPMGRVFPGSLFRGEGGKTVLALALVFSPDDLPAVLRFGMNQGSYVCVNQLRVPNSRYARHPDPDQEAANVWLHRGWNAILVRTSAATSDWGFAIRLALPDGQPFPGKIAKPTDLNQDEFLAVMRRAVQRSRWERLYAPPEPPFTGAVNVMSQRAREDPDDARTNFYLGSFLVSRRMMEGPERFDRELIFNRAMLASGQDPFFTLISARSVDSGLDGPDREENLRLVLLKSVADRGSAAALVDIGRLYLDTMRQPRRAGDYARMALSVNPMSLRAGVLEYDVAMAMGWKPLAGMLLEKLAVRHPNAEAARLRLGRSALAMGRFGKALGEFYAILGRDAANPEALEGAVLAQSMLGQTSAAVSLLVDHIARFPNHFPARLKLAELYRVLGREQEAREVIDLALALAPEDPHALSLLAELNQETYAEGKVAAKEPVKSLRQELDLSPTSPPPANGWEFLYFQVEDLLGEDGSMRRAISFAIRVHTPRAARILRHLGLTLDSRYERSVFKRLDIIGPDGQRQPFSPHHSPSGRGLPFLLPPLRPGMVVEAEVAIRRERTDFLGDYFGHIAPLSQAAPVRLSRYLFTSPKDRRVFFKPVNGAPEAMEIPSPDGREITRVWEMSNLAAFVPEPHSRGGEDLAPAVQVSSFGGWDDFARWYWRLIGVQYHSPPELRLLAQGMGKEGDPPLARLDQAARWVSRNITTRQDEYGPYAFRPINARSILSRLSADAKDRALLLCLMAREFGLEAWPVLSRLRGTVGGGPSVLEGSSLPLLDYFNHSLAMVQSPVGGNVFMEASNPYRPPGVMPAQLSGSPGMAVTPKGAERMAIPDNGTAACEWRETADLLVDEDGSILWEQAVSGTGTAAEALRRRFGDPDDNPEESRAWVEFLASIGGAPSTVVDEFREKERDPASAVWSGRARLRRYAAMADDRVILRIPPLPGQPDSAGTGFIYPLGFEEYARHGERTQSMMLPHGFAIVRKIAVRYPPAWRLVNGVESFERKYAFGAVRLKATPAEGKISLDFSCEIPGYEIAADDFAAFRDFTAEAGRWLAAELVWEKP